MPAFACAQMTLLLGDVPGSSVVAEAASKCTSCSNIKELEGDPKMCGRVFKMMAATLSERIGEASSKMRQEVAARAPRRLRLSSFPGRHPQRQQVPQLFNLHKDRP